MANKSVPGVYPTNKARDNLPENLALAVIHVEGKMTVRSRKYIENTTHAILDAWPAPNVLDGCAFVSYAKAAYIYKLLPYDLVLYGSQRL